MGYDTLVFHYLYLRLCSRTVHFRPVENSYENMNAKIEVKFLTGVVEKYEPLMTSSFFALMRGYSAGKKRGRLQTNIANMDL